MCTYCNIYYRKSPCGVNVYMQSWMPGTIPWFFISVMHLILPYSTYVLVQMYMCMVEVLKNIHILQTKRWWLHIHFHENLHHIWGYIYILWHACWCRLLLYNLNETHDAEVMTWYFIYTRIVTLGVVDFVLFSWWLHTNRLQNEIIARGKLKFFKIFLVWYLTRTWKCASKSFVAHVWTLEPFNYRSFFVYKSMSCKF